MTIHRYDETFIIEKNGYPYQVIEGMPEYTDLANEYAQHPETFTEEAEPAPYVPTAQEQAQAEINRLEAMQTPRLIREATNDLKAGLTTSYALDKLADIDALIAVQRAILTGG